jgi:hypothetical protein
MTRLGQDPFILRSENRNAKLDRGMGFSKTETDRFEKRSINLAHWRFEWTWGRTMTITVHGKVHGKTIELDSALSIPDGADVEVTIVVSKPQQVWGEGLKRSAGAAADIPEFDEVFAQIAQERKAAQFRESNP